MTETKDMIVRARAEHCVSRGDIDPDALKVLYRLSRAGYTAYLVGGGVRDLLLGRRPKDFDLGTDAHPGEIKRLFRNCFLVGRRFRLAHIRFGQKVIETSTFRKAPERDDASQPGEELYHHRDNTFGTPVEDAQRRDFTINGLFYDIKTFHVIDHVGGLNDLARGIVRSIGDPNIRFLEDPVRMLRAIRFASRLGFTIERKTYAAILRHREAIAQASAPRLLEEIRRLFAFRSALPAFRLIERTRFLPILFPEIHAFLRGADGNDQLFWRHLSALDACWRDDEEPPPLAVIFLTLAYPLFLRALAEANTARRTPNHLGLAMDVLEPLARRYGLPRRAFYSGVHVMASQRRFDEAAARRPSVSRLAGRPDFPEILLLRTVHLTATDGDLDSLAPWENLARKSGPPEQDKPDIPRGRPRRRGRRRRRPGP